MNDTLFEIEPAAEPAERLSADRARTQRRRALIEAGVHPLTRTALIEGRYCGGCGHAQKVNGYWKCDTVPHTFGPGTDIRLSWPACTRFEEKP